MNCFFFFKYDSSYISCTVCISDLTFSHGLVLKKQTKITIHFNSESQYFLKFTIHIDSAPKYRDTIESGDKRIVPAKVSQWIGYPKLSLDVNELENV